jgi:predicted enzyme related to lactoylglutathione lyase
VRNKYRFESSQNKRRNDRGLRPGQKMQEAVMIPTIQAVTITVSNLERSKLFYEEVLGFEPDVYYEPTRWQCYQSQGRAYLGIADDPEFKRNDSKDIINFDVDDLELLWKKFKENA